MAIYKNANLDISVSAEQNPSYNAKPSVQFSTQDKNTAKYTFTVKQNNKPVDLTGVTASVTLYSEDKSVFQSDATIISATEGKIEYVIPSEAIRHHGKTRGDLRLTYPNGDVLGGLRFSFNIEQALIDRAAGVVGGVYIRDFEQLKAEIEATAESIKDFDVVRIDTKLNELEQKVEEGGVGVDEQARQEIEGLTEQLADTANKNKIIGTSLKTFESPKNGIISFITDDGQIEDYNVVRPIFESAGVPCNTAIISDTIGDSQKYRMTLDQLYYLQNELGWEIQSHTMHHVHLNELSEEEQDMELRGSYEQLNNLGLKCESIAYPYGHYNETTKRLARKYYRSGRTTDKGIHGINYAPIDTYELKMIYLDSSATYPNDESGKPVNTFDFYKYYIDKNYNTNGWLIITFHSGDIANAGLASVLEQVVQYAKTKSPIMTYSKALDRMGNVIDIGDKSELQPFQKHYTVGYNGEISSNMLDFVFAKTNAYDSTTPIDTFPEFKVTVNKVLAQRAKDTNMPDGTGGILYTYKLEASTQPTQQYNHQVYVTLDENNVYQRFCKYNKSWGDWILTSSSMHRVLPNTYTGNTAITTFKKGFTINNVNAENAASSNLPEAAGGTLMTYKPSDTNGFSWQEYHLYLTNRKYRRYFNENGTPSAWVGEGSTVVRIGTPWTEIQPNTTISLEVTNAAFKSTNVVQINPFEDMPNGIFWNAVARDGKLIVRLTSARTSATAINAMAWNASIS